MAILPLLALFLTIREGCIYTFQAHIYTFWIAFSTILPCVSRHFTLRFAPKRKAFSTKAQTKDMKIGCKGLFINKLALKDKKRLGGFWRST